MILAAIALLLFCVHSAEAAAQDDEVGRLRECEARGQSRPAMKVHGLLYAANGGGSGYRIWLVGTRRIVWLANGVPDAIEMLFKPFDEELFGDFTLVPLAPDRPGVMRKMCFVAGQKLVIRDTRTGLSRRVRQH